MISIIICVSDVELLNALCKNIEVTIGCEYEIIPINNVERSYSICEAYNRGLDIAKYDIVCFCHQDIIFHTKHWGERVIAHMEDESIGLIGVAGNTIHPNVPAGWWNDTPFNDTFSSLIQRRREENKLVEYVQVLKNPNGALRENVITLDGLWLCCKKALFDNCRFDEKTFDSFHCYDTDICLQVAQNKRNVVVFDILIEHFSVGKKSVEWVESTVKLSNKWKTQLPIHIGNYSKKRITKFCTISLLIYCFLLLKLGYNSRYLRCEIQNNLRLVSFFLIPRISIVLLIWFIIGNNAVSKLHNFYRYYKK